MTKEEVILEIDKIKNRVDEKELTRLQIVNKLEEILGNFSLKIGTMGEDDYNENLDLICCRLYALKEEII